ncbi:MAG TPA: general secretion pathway protein GspH [Cyanobacteria bacterium UBA11149]|nr:general secretion pathway protein GspH [Cyanobacteria bacterium UBA11367]HBE57363.1 general secretion pathway protein GspH [Cyanobacteria bacterium UBA11366]HBK66987.1 general secretion pathway protein GspH [Cyanobacteria bacterium UBA11166]HBR76825.1 general secretion pathway protein GspH [Cyanobacteria bacterium UBA11159]HBS72582.1 general secretion pathway protein GspH [Cyanobacteria bacterium UBA11153]HBW90585.1 general secretion pathway protein GspH [Cyanobacteria bacterium UBA11149]H
MKLDLQAKFLQHLSQKKQDEGFTLIELLVVIIIIGILSAIALPSFLNQANKAKQVEAKTYVGSANRAQQAYYAENSKFVTGVADYGELGLGTATQTVNYKYGISAQDDGVLARAEPNAGTKAAIRAYIGGVKIGLVAGTGESTTLAILCEGDKAPVAGGKLGGSTETLSKMKASDSGPPECSTGYKPIEGK